MEPWLVWSLTAVLVLVGVVGTVVPTLPGAPVILAAAVLHKLLLPGFLTWWTLALLGVLTLLALAVDFLCTVTGAKALGATYWGVAGSAVGALVGLAGGLFGILLGAVAGAVLFELLGSRRSLDASLKAGLGAGLGLLASVAGRLALAAAMVLAFALDCFLY